MSAWEEPAASRPSGEPRSSAWQGKCLKCGNSNEVMDPSDARATCPATVSSLSHSSRLDGIPGTQIPRLWATPHPQPSHLYRL